MKLFHAIVNESRISLITRLVAEHMVVNEYRCYIKPAQVNGHPVGYGGAKTFKVVQCKPRRKKK